MPSLFEAKKILVEEVIWKVPIRRNFLKKTDVYASVNVSKLGIYKYIGQEEDSIRIDRHEIEGNAAMNFTPGGEKYIVSISSQILRYN